MVVHCHETLLLLLLLFLLLPLPPLRFFSLAIQFFQISVWSHKEPLENAGAKIFTGWMPSQPTV